MVRTSAGRYLEFLHLDKSLVLESPLDVLLVKTFRHEHHVAEPVQLAYRCIPSSQSSALST
jgi:hypothetical protein